MGLDPRVKQHVGRVVRNQREAKGISMRDLTEMCGVSASTICRMERGLFPRWDNAASVCASLGIELRYIIKEGVGGVQLKIKGSEIA